MNYLTKKLLNSEELKSIQLILEGGELNWENGKQTAGKLAAEVKNNLQLNRNSDLSKKYSAFVMKKILGDQLIKSFTLPKKVHGTMFSKSMKGMHYGRHIDNAFMSTGRADLSFTLFISDIDKYQGGELLIECLNTDKKFKLNSGEILIYPSTYLHSVQKILEGERLVFVGWIESYIKSAEEREYLFDIDAGAKGLLAKYGRSEELDLIYKSYSNLLRLLGK